jgi:hypothetical protein
MAEKISTKANGNTACIQGTISYDHVMIIKSCYRIVANIEVTVLNDRSVTRTQINTVVTAQNGNASHRNVLTLEYSMTPICTIHKGIAFKPYITATPKAHSVRSSILLFPLRIIAIYAVDI